MLAPVTIESLDQEGRGVARAAGKVIFIEGALPGEVVTYNAYRKKSNFELAQVGQILKPGFARVVPRCRHFGICGGCSMQHMDARAQVAAKQRILEDNLKHIGKVEPELILPAVYGAAWGYRYRARLSVRYVAKKGGVLVGFHEKRSSFVADMQACEVMPFRISALIMPLRELLSGLSIRDRVPQIEVSLGENVDVLVLRILAPLTPQDETLLKAFADQHHVQFFLQSGGRPETAYPFCPKNIPELNYTLPEFDIVIPFHPTEFTQVNPAMNRILVRRALSLLDPKPGERIADLFCGLGNFTLPIARRGAHVVGYEGSAAMVRRAGENSKRNGLWRSTQFIETNLFEINGAWTREHGHFDKMLLDPPREGAIAAVNSLGEGKAMPSRIVYISCNPATLARDAGVLAHEKGYVLKAAGVVNMFPHTAHVESVALFEKAAVEKE
ncbi:MAG: 23S rRNA (uracil(1939)-C(5))-methyltransferase RlmD [Pseudomonadota bacterium]|nr:23S rRNA (uracil(1939)-C(5))-methyltransferase RlmD [Pseudomonadota bacterium]